MYDLEVAHPEHNFFLENGIVTSNSHAVCYGTIAYACAFIKHYYPVEWWCAVLQNAKKDEIGEKFWRYCKKWVDQPDINFSTQNFRIENYRIRTPLSIVKGVGEKAHEELVKGLPYKDIQDLCDKVQAHKVAGAKPAFNKDGSRKKDKAGNELYRLGGSALNRGVVYKLIVCGVMDSLFPKDKTTLEKLAMYEEALAKAGEKKKVDKVKPVYADLTALSKYQLQKQLLPIFSKNLIPILEDMKIDGIEKSGNRSAPLYYLPNQAATIGSILKQTNRKSIQSYTVVNGNQLKTLNEAFLNQGQVVRLCVAAYMTEPREFAFRSKQDNVQKSAIEYNFDVDGEQFKFVQWAPRDQRKALGPVNVEGAIALVLLSRYSADRPCGVDAVIILQEPLDLTEKSKDEDGDN